MRTRTDPALLNALSRAFRWHKLPDEGRYGSVSELAAREKIERGYLGKVLQLALLPPDMVQAIRDGRQGVSDFAGGGWARLEVSGRGRADKGRSGR